MTIDENQLLVSELREAVRGKWPHPPALDSCVFLAQEVMEISDVLMRMGHGTLKYVRSNVKGGARHNLAHEIGDAMLMLCTVANHFDINISDSLLMRCKHWATHFGEQVFTIRRDRYVKLEDVRDLLFELSDIGSGNEIFTDDAKLLDFIRRNIELYDEPGVITADPDIVAEVIRKAEELKDDDLRDT